VWANVAVEAAGDAVPVAGGGGGGWIVAGVRREEVDVDRNERSEDDNV
jgi:hypothetical protein